MKSKNIGQMYFARQRKLLELERNSTEASQNRKQAIHKRESKIQKLMIFAMVMAFLILINGAVVPPH
jgi:cell division protein FtsL